MSAAKNAIATLVRLGIAVAFAGLGVLGVGLMGASVLFSAAAGWRVVVFVLGLLAVVIAVEGVPIMAGRTA